MKYSLPNSLYDCVLDDNKVYLLIISDTRQVENVRKMFISF